MLQFLRPSDVFNLSGTCQTLRRVSRDPRLWKKMAFPPLPTDVSTIRKHIFLLNRASFHGNADASFRLGCFWHFGEAGLAVDFNKAREFYRRAASCGSDRAAYNLGCLFDKGNGVERDAWEATKWFTVAANAGNANAQNALGINFETGDGVPKQDLPLALEWYTKAAKSGLGDAFFNLGLLHYYGRGVPRSLRESFGFFSRASQKGDSDAIVWALRILHEMPGMVVSELGLISLKPHN